MSRAGLMNAANPWARAVAIVAAVFGPWLVGMLIFFPVLSRAQGLPAPAGSGWIWTGGLVEFNQQNINIPAPAGSVLEVRRVYRQDQVCGAEFLISDTEYRSSTDVYGQGCFTPDYVSYLPDPDAGQWYRVLALSPEPPASAPAGPASAPATTGDIQQLGEGIGVLLQALTGFGGFLLLMAGFGTGRGFM